MEKCGQNALPHLQYGDLSNGQHHPTFDQPEPR